MRIVRKKNIGFKIGLLLLILSLFLIGNGIHINYLSSPKRIFKTAINALANSINYNESIKKTSVKESSSQDSLAIDSIIKLNISSEYLTNKAVSNQTYLKYSNLIKNLNNIKTNIFLAQNNKDQELLLTTNSTLENHPLIYQKYYIKGATEYYYNANLSNNYINNGNNTYFELFKNTSIKENKEYLKNSIINSIKNNLANQNFKNSRVELNNEPCNKTSIKITAKVLKEITDNISNDLKKDPKIVNLLNLLNSNIEPIDLFAELDQLNYSLEEITINIYTDRIKYNNLKLELIIKSKEEVYRFDYDYKTNIILLYKDDNLLYTCIVTNNDSNIKVKILSKEKQNLGYISFEKLSTKQELEIDFNDGTTSCLGSFIIESNMQENNQDYPNLKAGNLRIVSKNIELINLNYTVTSSIKSNPKIAEDITSSIFKSSLTSTEKEEYTIKTTENFNKLFQ